MHRHTALVGSLISIIFTFNGNGQHNYLGLSNTHTKYRIDTGYSTCVEKKPTKQSVSYMNRKEEREWRKVLLLLSWPTYIDDICLFP